ncbi:uncharacterized protein [Nicotiana tomentosiformis]|uniref:uncharacterized protein n=1 Tax=Nicotiana tomentosiformis TaxID=4098 RepID=UPI00388C72BD
MHRISWTDASGCFIQRVFWRLVGLLFTTFQLTGAAFRWWETYERRRPVGATPLSWHEFSVLFLEKFVPQTHREELRWQFEYLRQEDLSVTQYEMQFSELARHAVWLVPSEREKIRRFIKGLNHQFRFIMTLGNIAGAKFDEVVNNARWIEMVRTQEREEREAKRSRGSGSSGSYSGSRGPPQNLPPFFKRDCYECGELGHDTVQHGDARDITIQDDGVLRMQGQISVPNVDGLQELILEEAQSSRYSINPGAAKMYQVLRKYYWWRRMKKDIVGFTAQCLNCQQVKCEYQRPGGLL